MSRVGIYGGTFDPIHNGHLHVITQLIQKNLIDYLLIVPAGVPLLRENAPLASGTDRRKMCQLAISTLPPEVAKRVEVNPIEILRDGPSYSIDTVEAVRSSFKGDEIFLIIGADAYTKIDQWHRTEELQKIASIICINRPGFSSKGIDIAALDISASAVRSGALTDVPDIVAVFIRQNALYGN